MEPTHDGTQANDHRSANETWSLEVVDDPRADGTILQLLLVVAQSTRLILGVEQGPFIAGQQLASSLDQVANKHGYPKAISTDNCQVYRSSGLKAWTCEHKVKHCFKDASRPKNESSLYALQKKLREGVLVPGDSPSQPGYQEILADWIEKYNASGPASKWALPPV